MPWSGGVFTRTNGTYNGPTVWATDAANNVKIMSGRHDTHDQDLASGINACVAKDGSNTITSLNLTATVNATTGVITIGGVVFANMIGTGNCFVGGAGNLTTTGGGNVAVGPSALSANTTGSASVAIGNYALQVNTSGSNIAIGYQTLFACTTGSANTGVGYSALTSNTTGYYNTAFGVNALQGVTTGNMNTAIGFQADVPSATANYQLSICNIIYGISVDSTGHGFIGIGVQAPTAALHLKAGTATAGTAPLKLTSGTNLTTPENGAFEFDGTNLYFTVGGVRKTVTLT